MHFGSFPAPSVAIFVVILGLSFAVARLDFIRRRGKQRTAIRRTPAPTTKSTSVPPGEAPKLSAAEPEAKVILDPQAKINVEPLAKINVEALAKINVEPQAKGVADPPAIKRMDRITRLPGTDRAIVPTLAYGHVVPLPMPAPKSPKYAWRRTTVTWWPQES
jgi:hypothetical protein